jgi:hypothetical protein
VIYHILRFALQDHLTDDKRSEVCRQINSLRELPSVVSAVVCQDLGHPDDGFTHSAIITLASEEDYKTYLTDPGHAVVIDYVIPRWKKAMFCDAAEDFDEGLYGRIQETMTNMGMRPELVSHMENITAHAQPVGETLA